MTGNRQSKHRRSKAKVRQSSVPGPVGHEVSGFQGRSVEETLALADPQTRHIAYTIRRQKSAGTRPMPSRHLVSSGSQPTQTTRERLLDKIASLVDENIFGRSEMCIQFAILLEHALTSMGMDASARVGSAEYLRADGTWFKWPQHAWVQVGDEVVDGNIDSVVENPIPRIQRPPSTYWGPASGLPPDRKFPIDHVEAAIRDRESPEVRYWCRQLTIWLTETRFSNT
jgi:hypothetical protein